MEQQQLTVTNTPSSGDAAVFTKSLLCTSNGVTVPEGAVGAVAVASEDEARIILPGLFLPVVVPSIYFGEGVAFVPQSAFEEIVGASDSLARRFVASARILLALTGGLPASREVTVPFESSLEDHVQRFRGVYEHVIGDAEEILRIEDIISLIKQEKKQ